MSARENGDRLCLCAERESGAGPLKALEPAASRGTSAAPVVSDGVRIALVMFAAVGVLAASLAAMAVTDSAIPGWIAVAAMSVWGIGRLLIWGGFGDDGEVR